MAFGYARTAALKRSEAGFSVRKSLQTVKRPDNPYDNASAYGCVFGERFLFSVSREQLQKNMQLRKKMRKAQKEQAEALVGQMEEAHDQIKRYIEKNSIPSALKLLEDCQNAGITIGTLIEETEGEGHAAVAALEEYCDLIGQIFEDLAEDREKAAGAGKIYKLLRRRLIKAENSLKNDVPVRTEAVFLPYKASMWDSLESVWQAADADPDCDAYVIPIPYYDKNPDGSFREMHYEGDQYPAYVPITRYDAFDLEAHHPDMIFIHNPYDAYNYVTSVHPDFYSDRLKKLTDKLVYIPYFILGEVDPEDDAVVEGVKHFVTTQAVLNADKVIVQSEAMKQVYIRALLDATDNHSEEARAYWDEKILGLGSPKVDKVLRTGKEDVEVPAGWLSIIEKPDGTWKKIIFYNTGIAALLEHNEKMLDKIEDVLRVFYENRDEVALLWRPHPLIESTLKSMRPQLWERYREIVRRYRTEGWGIYDDTADMDRAVAVSDGYYGDFSSVAELYKETEKVILIQNPDVKQKDFGKVCVLDAVYFREQVWFSACYFNGLFALNRKTGKVEFSGQFPGEETNSWYLYSSAIAIDNRIYFIPFLAKTIAIFNVEKKTFSDIALDKKYVKSGKNRCLFMGTEKYKQYIFIFPVFGKCILRLNTENGQLVYITEWLNQIKDIVFDTEDGFFRQQCVIREEKIYVPFCNVNAVMELDCNTLITKIHVVGKKKVGYSGISFDGSSFWLSPRAYDHILKWNPNTNEKEEIRICSIKREVRPYAYVGILCLPDKVVIYHSEDQKEWIDTSEKRVEIAEGNYSFVKSDGEKCIYYRSDLGMLAMFDTTRSCKEEIEVIVENELCMNLCMNERKIIYELPEKNLVQLILLIKKEKKVKKKSMKNCKYGNKIYQKI